MLLNPLFEETVEFQNQSVKQAWRDSTRQESQKMLNNTIAIEYKYPCIYIGVHYMVIQRILHRTKILIAPWLNISPYGRKYM